jgi:hypothetical protein
VAAQLGASQRTVIPDGGNGSRKVCQRTATENCGDAGLRNSCHTSGCSPLYKVSETAPPRAEQEGNMWDDSGQVTSTIELGLTYTHSKLYDKGSVCQNSYSWGCWRL